MSNLGISYYFPFPRVKLVDQVFFDRTDSVMIRIEPDLRFDPLCHRCRNKALGIHSHDHHRAVRDLNLGTTTTWLDVGYRKIVCAVCDAVRVEDLSFCDAGQRITHRMARYIYELCKVMTVEEVARHLDLDPKTVKAVDYAGLRKEFGGSDYSGLRILAVDEIALKKGHRYMTVVLDYQTGRVVWMGEGRDMNALDEFFQGLTVEQKAGIEAVAMDMWEPYLNRVRHHCPKAKLVFDFFHVVKAFGQVIDEVRRDEYRKATEDHKKILQGSRYLLLKNLDHLTDPQRDRLEELRSLNETINRVYLLKDQLKTLYWYTNREYAERALETWCTMADRIDHPAVQKFAGRLRFFREGILNHCDCPIDTGKLEGVNNKIKLIKRRAFGFHDPDYFVLKVKQAFPGRPAPKG